MKFLKTKQFWIEIIKECDNYYGFQKNGKTFKNPNWERDINNATKLKVINKLGRELRKEVALTGGVKIITHTITLNNSEETELVNCIEQDIEDHLKETVLKTEHEAQKNHLEEEKKEIERKIQEFENGIKAVVGDNLTDWNKNIVKAGYKDSDIVNLQSKVSTLASEKDNLDRQLKEKQDQWNNHKCDTPNNDELNQVKNQLGEVIRERDKLKTEIGNNSHNPNGSKNNYVPLILGLFGLLIVGFWVYFVVRHKKKKKKTTIIF